MSQPITFWLSNISHDEDRDIFLWKPDEPEKPKTPFQSCFSIIKRIFLFQYCLDLLLRPGLMAFNNEELIEFNVVVSSSSLETLGSKNGENGDFFRFCISSLEKHLVRIFPSISILKPFSLRDEVDRSNTTKVIKSDFFDYQI